MTEPVALPYRPLRLFVPFHERKQRNAVMVAHRRAGKTVATLNDMIARAWMPSDKWSKRRYGYIAPFRSQAKTVAWEYLKHYADPLMAEKSEVDLSITLHNGSHIRLFGADNPDALRGGYFDGVVIDELADMRPSLRTLVVAPMLTDHEGWEVLIGTPKGKNAFYDAYEKGLLNPHEWFTGSYRASETHLLPEEELAKSRSKMSKAEFLQEYECSFEAAIMGAYYAEEMAEAEREGRIHKDGIEIDPLEPIHTAWDLGHGVNMAVWAFQALRGRLNIIDCLNVEGWFFKDYVNACNERRWGGTDIVPHDIVKADDIDGPDRSRIKYMFDHDRKPIKLAQHSLDDGINAAKITFPTVHFDASNPRVVLGMEALRNYKTDWDEKARIFKNTPRHDWSSHFADAFRYLALGWREMSAKPEVAKPHVIGVPLTDLTHDQFFEFEDQPVKRERV